MSETFTEQLRRIDDADLDPYQFRLVMHYWRVGKCWESLRTTAEKCGMSLGKAHEVRQWLIDNEWIEFKKVETGPGKRKMAIVLCSPREQERSQHEQCSPDEHECSPDEQIQQDNVHDMNAILNEPSYLNEPSEVREKRERAPNAFWSIPPPLETEPFLEVWSKWLKHVDEAGLTFTETQAALKLAELEEAGLKLAINSVLVSLLKGWRNIHITDEGIDKRVFSKNGHEKKKITLVDNDGNPVKEVEVNA